MKNQTSLMSTTVICRLSYFFLLFSLRRSFKHYCGFSPWKVFRISKCLCFCLGRNFQERVNSKNVKYLGIPGLHFHQKSPYLCSCWARTFSLSMVAGLRGEGPARCGGLTAAVREDAPFPTLGEEWIGGLVALPGGRGFPCSAVRPRKSSLVCTPKPYLGGGVINFPYPPLLCGEAVLVNTELS